MPIYKLTEDPQLFPSVELAEADGLLAIGGDLSPERLLAAYSRGIFPWYSEDQPLMWWYLRPRCVVRPQEIQVSKSMRRLMRSTKWKVTMDKDFSGVIHACKNIRRSDQDGTWITGDLERSMIRLHELGHAHSVEVWEGDNLVGGLYGLCVDRLFCGESMFARQSNASKVALVELCRHVSLLGYELIDCQQVTDHLLSMGADVMSHDDFQVVLSRQRTDVGKVSLWSAYSPSV